MGATTDVELLERAVRNPGRLCLGPSTTAGSFPYGGVSLGFTRRMELRLDVTYHRTKDPASGMLAEVGRRTVENLALGCVLEGVPWDEDLLRSIFNKSTRSADLTYKSPPETRITGASNPAVVQALPPILFCPYDAAGESVYIRRPLPLLSLEDAIRLAQDQKATLPLILAATAVLNLDPWNVCRLENQVVP